MHIAHFVPNFVVRATGVGRGEMQLAAFDGPSRKPPYRRKNLAKISCASRVIAHFVPNFVAWHWTEYKITFVSVRPCVQHFLSYLPSTFSFPSPSPFPSPSLSSSPFSFSFPFLPLPFPLPLLLPLFLPLVLPFPFSLPHFPSLFPSPSPGCHGNEIWDKMGYNLACVQDFFAIFASIGGFSGTGYRMLPIVFFPDRPHCPGNEIWDKMGYMH